MSERIESLNEESQSVLSRDQDRQGETPTDFVVVNIPMDNSETEEDGDNSEPKNDEDTETEEGSDISETNESINSENAEEEGINSENREDISNAETEERIISFEAEGHINNSKAEEGNNNSQTEEPLSGKPWLMFRVPANVRKVDERDYNPNLVSIGPFHHKAWCLNAFENLKSRFLRRLLKQFSERNAPVILEDSMKEIEEKTRKCYSESFDDINSDDFVQMMVLDGCFIVELLRLYDKSCKGEQVAEPIFTAGGILSAIRRDLLKIENQLPMFVLEELFHLTSFSRETTSLNKLALQFFEPTRPGKDKLLDENLNANRKYQHLLALFQSSFDPNDYRPSPNRPERNTRERRPSHNRPERRNRTDHHRPSPSRRERSNTREPRPSHNRREGRSRTDHHRPSPNRRERSNIREPHPSHNRRERRNRTEHHRPSPNPSPNRRERSKKYDILPGKGWIDNAKSLSNCGVLFRNKSGGLLGIEFRNKVLKIPTLFIDDGSSTVLRNLLAYEQCDRDAARYFTCLAVFFYSIVDTAEDVKLLREAGIIKQAQGDDEQVVNLLKSLTKELEFDIDDCLIIKLIKDVDRSCRSWTTRTRICLRRCFSPTGLLKLIVLYVILILTAHSFRFRIRL